MTKPVLGRPSLEESYLSLANWSGSGPSRVKWSGQGWCPCQRDKLCLLHGLWPQGLWLSLSHGGLQLLKPGRAGPNNKVFITGRHVSRWKLRCLLLCKKRRINIQGKLEVSIRATILKNKNRNMKTGFSGLAGFPSHQGQGLAEKWQDISWCWRSLCPFCLHHYASFCISYQPIASISP